MATSGSSRALIQSVADLLASRRTTTKRYIMGGNVTGQYENGTYEIKSGYGTGAFSLVPAPGRHVQVGSGVLLASTNGDSQDVVALGLSGYYYP